MTNSERLRIYEWCDKNKDNVGATRIVKNTTSMDRRYLREGLVLRRGYVRIEVLDKTTHTANTRPIRISITELQKQEPQ